MVGELIGCDCDLLAYWSSRDIVWRNLAKVTRGLLSVPASSRSSERSFSLAGNTLADRRSRLSPELGQPDVPSFMAQNKLRICSL